jgi:hypothetical protein
LTFFLVVCLAAVLCLGPLAGYLLWLTTVTRRDRPTLVTGPWDFAALLVGLSGFVLFGGVLLLTLVQSNARFLTRGNFEAIRNSWGQEKTSWTLVTMGYVVMVFGGVYVTLVARRRSLVVYNVEPERFEAAVTEVFEHRGMPLERRGNTWSSGVPLFELEPFAAGKTVTLRWLSDDRLLFQDVERQLREALRVVVAPENPSTRWFAAFTSGSVIVIAFCFVFLVGVIFFR